MTNELYLIKNLLIECAEMGAAKCLKKLKPKADEITQRQAYDDFGEAWIKQYASAGILKGERRGTSRNSPVYYSRAECLALKYAEKASQLGVFENTRL